MMADERLLQIRSLIDQFETLGPPSVDPVEPEVRSGVDFLFRDPLKRGVPADEQEIIRDLIEQGGLLGGIIVEWGYDVEFKQAKEFRRWLLDNEVRLRGSTPEDVNYRGTYGVWSSTEKAAGDYRTIWVFNSLRGLQNMSAALANEESLFARLISQLNDFRDRRPGAGRSQQHYVPAASAHRF